MDLTAEEYIDGLLSKEAYDQPSDSIKPDVLEMKLPEWFDEKLYNRGRKFYWQFCFGLTAVWSPGVVAVFAIPTILDVLVGSRRSSTQYTAFKRYLSTSLHMSTWFKYELKPGTLSWKSLYTVRSRHFMTGRAARLKKQGTISQRDIALSQFGFIGFVVLKPDMFGVRQLEDGDWDAYNYFWRVIGYMVGLEDRYNMCRKNMDETRKVCQLILDHVYTPCLENVPEYFEYMSRVMINGMWAVNPTMETGSLLYLLKNLADVPGYVLTESERIAFQARLRKQLNGKPDSIGVESTSLILKSSVEGLPERPPRLLFVKDYDTIESAPEYKKLSLASKYKLSLGSLMIAFYTTFIGRWLLNLYYIVTLYMNEYFPYVAFIMFGIKNSYTNIFTEDPIDDTPPKPNSEYYKPQPPEPWYKALLSFW